MSDSVQNSSMPPRHIPKSTLRLDTAAYLGLDLNSHDIDDTITLVVRARVKMKSASPHEKGELGAELAILDIQDKTPDRDRDETNRLV